MMSMIDCVVMRTNDVKVDAGGKGNHWDAWSYMLRNGEIHRPILNTNDGIFQSKKQAMDWMNRVVKAVKSIPEDKLWDKDEYVKALNPLNEEVITLNQGREREKSIREKDND